MTNYWYAIMMDADDTDWGFGFYDFDKALTELYYCQRKHPDAYIAVIDEEGSCCVEEIRKV